MNRKQELTGLALAVGLYLNGAYAEYPRNTIKANMQQTIVVSKGNKPLSRTEAMLTINAYNSDIHLVGQYQDNNQNLGARLQLFPFEYRYASWGIVGEYHSSTGGESESDVGIVTRVKYNPSKQSFFKIDVRYFPENNTITTKTLLDTKHSFIDLAGSYSLDSTRTVLIPGIDYKITDNLFIGVEGRFSGNIDGIKKDYVGLRGGIKY